MSKFIKKNGADAGRELLQLTVYCSCEDIARLDRFMSDVAIPGTSRTAAARFVLLTGLDYLENEKAKLKRRGREFG